VADRLRELLDLVLDSLDEPDADGRALAERAYFSRDHLDRLLAAATGESPVALRRRLLVERAAWQLQTGAATPGEAAPAAGYGSLAAFSRAFTRAHGVAPSEFAGSGRPFLLEAPNGIHFHPPAGLLIPGARETPPGRDLTDRMISHHLARVRELLEAAATLPAAELERELRPGLVVVWFEGEEASAALMAERLVYTLEVWVAAIQGQPAPGGGGELLPRFERASVAFAPARTLDPRPRGLGRRLRRRALRTAAVLHLWRCHRPRAELRRGPPRGTRRRPRGARRPGVLLGRPDRVGAGANGRGGRLPALSAGVDQRSFCSFGTRPASVPFSCRGPPGATMPSTRIAFSPSDRRSRPSVDDTSSSVSSFTRSKR
jgi:AraC family transcriptional regulator